jgi:hypothetical protein
MPSRNGAARENGRGGVRAQKRGTSDADSVVDVEREE